MPPCTLCRAFTITTKIIIKVCGVYDYWRLLWSSLSFWFRFFSIGSLLLFFFKNEVFNRALSTFSIQYCMSCQSEGVTEWLLVPCILVIIAIGLTIVYYFVNKVKAYHRHFCGLVWYIIRPSFKVEICISFTNFLAISAQILDSLAQKII